MYYSTDDVKMSDKNKRLLKKLNEQTQIIAYGIEKNVEFLQETKDVQNIVSIWAIIGDIIYDIFQGEDDRLVIQARQIDGLKECIDDMPKYLDFIGEVIDVELPRIKNKKQLAENLSIYCKDYLDSFLELSVEYSDSTPEEMKDLITERKIAMRNSFLKRAGFNFEELYLPASDAQPEDDGR